MHDSDASDLSSYASGTSSDGLEIHLNASNDARSNTPQYNFLALTFQVFFIDKQMNENNVVALKAPGEKLPCNDLCFIDFSSKPYLKKNPNLLAVLSQASMIFEIFESATPCDFNQISEEGTVANELLCVALSMDATRFVTGGSDTVIKVYDLTTRLRLLNLKSGHYYGPQVVGSDGIDIDGMQNIIVASSWVRSGVMLKMWKFADFSITGSSLAAKRKILQNYSKPVNEVALEGSESTTQGYVARMGGEGRYIFYAGYGMNVLKVIDRESMNIVAGLTDLPNAVYSLDSCLDPRDKRRCLLVFTNAKNVYLASLQSRFNFLEVAST
ncbi:unnamed protein product [Taenia asiatica]|uniref:WD_REPEATS_REGION domain-containing protein n=1 Tax=Taenia asiatica TaxID=60517 RepID=A0A0R3W6G8_TAEAS|nr:unnamed protein product [Taenia asiatica]